MRSPNMRLGPLQQHSPAVLVLGRAQSIANSRATSLSHTDSLSKVTTTAGLLIPNSLLAVKRFGAESGVSRPATPLPCWSRKPFRWVGGFQGGGASSSLECNENRQCTWNQCKARASAAVNLRNQMPVGPSEGVNVALAERIDLASLVESGSVRVGMQADDSPRLSCCAASDSPGMMNEVGLFRN